MPRAKKYGRGSNKIVKSVKSKKLSEREKLIKDAEKKGIKLRTDWSALYKKPKKVSKKKVVKSKIGRS